MRSRSRREEQNNFSTSERTRDAGDGSIASRSISHISHIGLSAISAPLNSQTKPKLTLDEFFNSVELQGRETLAGWELSSHRNRTRGLGAADLSRRAVAVSNLGRIGNGEFGNGQSRRARPVDAIGARKDAAMVAGRTVDRVSLRAKGARMARGTDRDDEDSDDDKGKEDAQLYLISPNGGEAFAVTSGSEEVHAFGWARGFEGNLLCDARALDEAADRRS